MEPELNTAPSTPVKKKTSTGKVVGIGCGAIAALTIVIIALGAIFGPSKEERAADQTRRDSLAVVAKMEDSMKTVQAKAAYDALPPAVKDSIKRATRDSAARVEQSRKEQEAIAEAHEKEVNPSAYLSVANWSWQAGGFGSVGILNITFQNKGVKAASDILIKVDFLGESGTVVSSNTKKVTTVVPPGKRKSVGDVNLGFIDSQAKSARIEILSAEFQ